MKIGETIRSIRESRSMNQIELAKLCKLTQSYLSLVENGVRIPSPGALKKIGNALGTPDHILTLLSIELSDVPAKKREAYKILYPTIESLIKSIFVSDSNSK